MTAIKEREVAYVEKDAKPPLVISENPADHTPFDKKDEYWRYLPARQFDGFASTAPAAGEPNFQVSNASVVHSFATGGINGLRVRDVVTATALATEHNQFIVTVDKAANGKLVELDLSATSESSGARNSSGRGIGQNSSPARSAAALTASRTSSSPITPAVR